MKVSHMQMIDRWVGAPACLLLTWWSRLTGLFGGRAARPIRRVAFIKLAEQGSTVLAIPALKHVQEAVGRSNVYIVVFEENRGIIDALDLLPADQVVVIPGKKPLNMALGALAAIRTLRRLKIDATIDMEFFARATALLSYLSGAHTRIGFDDANGRAPYRGALLTHPVQYSTARHTLESFLDLASALPATAATPPGPQPTADEAMENMQFTFSGTAEERAAAEALIRSAARGEGLPLVLFNANCSDLLPLRKWPSERYLELARRMLAKYPELHIAFTGGPSEGPGAEALVRQVAHPRCFSLAGRTTLKELLNIYGLSRLLVTNDSGPAHFASVTPIHVIVLFGPETPRLYRPRSATTHVIYAEKDCSPCVSAYNNRITTCTNNICMKDITVDEVFAVAGRAYEAAGALAR